MLEIVIGFSEHIEIATASNYFAIANSHTTYNTARATVLINICLVADDFRSLVCRNIPGLSYQLFTGAAHFDGAPAVLQRSHQLTQLKLCLTSCLKHIRSDRVENAVPLLQRSCLL